MRYIYRILNKINKKVYIGQTIDFDNRCKGHLLDLQNNRHVNYNLQEDYNVFGKNVFDFKVIEECSDSEALNREDYWIDYYGGINDDMTYNIISSRHKNYQFKLAVSKFYKGKSHIEIHGYEKALQMRKLNSEKHKGKVPVTKGKTKLEYFGEKSAKRQAEANSLAHKGQIPFNKNKTKNLNGEWINITDDMIIKVLDLKNQKYKYNQISLILNINKNCVRRICIGEIQKRCND